MRSKVVLRSEEEEEEEGEGKYCCTVQMRSSGATLDGGWKLT